MSTRIIAPTRIDAYLRDRVDAGLRLFANVLFAVSLLAFWGLLTLIGVIVTQERETAWYFANYPAPLARLITRLGFDTIYHGPAYLGIIGLILASLAVCTFKRVIPARMPALNPVATDRFPLNARIAFTQSEETARARFENFLREAGWQVRGRLHDGVEWTFGDRHNWARRGVLVAHIGFVILAAGTCIYWARGFSGRAEALVGADAFVTQTGAKLHLNAFHARIDPIQTKSGTIYQPIDYVSDLTVTSKSGTVRHEILRVNHPLDVDGVLVYQSAYGMGVHMRVTHDGRPVTGAEIPDRALLEGEGFTLPGTERSVRYEKFVGTIGLGGVATADPRPNNPGALLAVFDGDTESGEILVPLDKTIDLGGGYALAPDALRSYSGFDYRFDPGIPVVGVGAFVLLAGFCICLYLVPARLHARFAREDGGCAVHLAATTVKGHAIFEEQFAALLAALQKETAGA